MKSSKRTLIAAIAAMAITLIPVAPLSAITVFDPKNFSQNLLTAVRSLQQINNQIRQLQNEAQMIVYMARHLERLDYSSLGAINQALSQINILMTQAEGIAFDVQQTEAIFAERYPKQYDEFLTNDQLGADARARWEYSMDAYRQTLRVQAHVSQSVAVDQALINRLVTSSQASVGMLQAQQATNQLIALTAQQTAKSQHMMAAQYRAEALGAARKAEAQEQARARYTRFIGDGRAYMPAN